MQAVLSSMGEQVVDAEEESFLLFTRDIPSANLGFLDSRAASVEVSIHGHDLTIHQSPTLLSSHRSGGTTGAVLWKITPRFAEWISSPATNPLWKSSILTPSATVVELGCGISGLVALSLAPLIRRFIATDQEYVRRLFRENIDENAAVALRLVHNHPHGFSSSSSSSVQSKEKKKSAAGKRGMARPRNDKDNNNNNNNQATQKISFMPLDWELDDVPSTLKETISDSSSTNHTLTERRRQDNDSESHDRGFDLLISCDCIYNEALVPSFVRTCADICRLRPAYTATTTAAAATATSLDGDEKKPTICVIAQQQRSPDVFETWLRETLRMFDVWRLSDEVLGDGLRDGTGYVVHVLVLRG